MLVLMSHRSWAHHSWPCWLWWCLQHVKMRLWQILLKQQTCSWPELAACFTYSSIETDANYHTLLSISDSLSGQARQALLDQLNLWIYIHFKQREHNLSTVISNSDLCHKFLPLPLCAILSITPILQLQLAVLGSRLNSASLQFQWKLLCPSVSLACLSH